MHLRWPWTSVPSQIRSENIEFISDLSKMLDSLIGVPIPLGPGMPQFLENHWASNGIQIPRCQCCEAYYASRKNDTNPKVKDEEDDYAIPTPPPPPETPQRTSPISDLSL